MNAPKQAARELLKTAAELQVSQRPYEANKTGEAILIGYAVLADWERVETLLRGKPDSWSKGLGIAALHRYRTFGFEACRGWLADMRLGAAPLFRELVAEGKREHARVLLPDVLGDESLHIQDRCALVQTLLSADLEAGDVLAAAATAERAPLAKLKTEFRGWVVRAMAKKDTKGAENLAKKIRQKRGRAVATRYIEQARADTGEVDSAAQASDAIADLRQRLLLRAHIARLLVTGGQVDAAFALHRREVPEGRDSSHNLVIPTAIARALAEVGRLDEAESLRAQYTEFDARQLSEAMALGHLAAGRVSEAEALLPDVGESLLSARHGVAEWYARAGDLDHSFKLLGEPPFDPNWHDFFTAILESDISHSDLLERALLLPDWRRGGALFKLSELFFDAGSPLSVDAALKIDDEQERVMSVRRFGVPYWRQQGDLDSPRRAFESEVHLFPLTPAEKWVAACVRGGRGTEDFAALFGDSLAEVLAGAARWLMDDGSEPAVPD